MLPSRFIPGKWLTSADGYLPEGTVRLWEPGSRAGLPLLLLGGILGLASAYFIAEGVWYLALLLVLLLPSLIVLLHYPFVATFLLLFVFPFFKEDPSTLGTLAYWAFYRLAIPIALVIAVLSDWLGLRNRPSARFGIAELAMVYFLLLGAFSIVNLTEADPRAPIRFYDLVVIPFCAYWFMRIVAPDERDLRRLARLAVVLVVVQSTVGFLNWFSPQVLPAHWLRPDRTSGTFGSPHPYTVTLTFASLLLIPYLVDVKQRWFRLVLVGTVVIGFVGVFFSFSRGSWLGAVLAILGLLLRYPRATASIVLGTFALGSVLATSLLADDVAYAWNRLTTERTAENRIIVYAAALRMIEVKPLLGWGFGNYEHYDEQFKARVEGIPASLGEDVPSHNVYLTIGVEMGLIGLALYLLPTGWWLLQSLRHNRRLPERGLTSRTLLFMLWLAMLQQFSVSNFSDLFTSQPFGTTLWWMTLGLIASLVGPYATSDKGRARALAGASLPAPEAPQ